MEWYYWLLAVLVLGVVILIHEIGHFWAARWMKVRIEEFGIGFPPRILTLGVRNGVKYTLNWIPIGGFVRLAGEEDPAVEGSLAGKKPWQRLIVLTAGVVMNLALAFLLFTGLAMYGREELVSQQVGVFRVEPGSPAEEAGILPGDLIREIDGRPIRSGEDVRLEIQLNRGCTITMVLQRDGQTVETEVGVRRDPPPGQGAVGIAMTYYEAPLVVWHVEKGSQAEAADLHVGDIIVGVNGATIGDSLDFEIVVADLNGKATLGSLAAQIIRAGIHNVDVQAFLHREVELAVRRNGELKTVRMLHSPNSSWPLGVVYLETVWKTYPLGYGLAEGGRETVFWALLIPRTLGSLFRGSVSLSDVSGPVGIAYLTGLAVQYGGLYNLLQIMAIISVNLGLINLLPIPAFDGGRLVFVLLEWIRGGRRIPAEREGLIHMVFFILLVGLLLYITFSDIMRIVQMTGGP